MRTAGLVDSAVSRLPEGHVCWPYRDRAEFRARAGQYLADAFASGYSVWYFASGSSAELRAELAGFDGLSERVRESVGVRPIEEFYSFDSRGVIDPACAVGDALAAMREAQEAGHAGLRFVGDPTGILQTAQQRAGFARFEYLLDREMSTAPLDSLCVYDAGELGDAAVAELACLHPLAKAGSTAFQLYADHEEDIALAGEIDLACRGQFSTALGHLVDAQQLMFIDQRGLIALADHARQAGIAVRLRTRPEHVTARLVDLLDIADLRVESIS